jgi:hypothetical protein
MDIDDLRIPEVESIESFAPNLDYETRLYLLYSNIVEKTKLGQELIIALTNDQRVNDLSGNLISKGNFAQIFDVKALAMWFIWCAKELGEEAAKGHLHDFLNSEKIEVISTLWVLGIDLDKPIELEGGYGIQPIKDMPNSSDKVLFLQGGFGEILRHTSQPVAAITKSCLVKKVLRKETRAEDKDKVQDFEKSGKKLYDITMLLNLLNNVSCLPYYSTSYTNLGTPLGPFGGRGGSSNLYDVIGSSLTKISSQERVKINAIINSFESLDNPEKVRVARILNRLSQAKRRTQIEDKILDLGIALEMLLLHPNPNNAQLSLSFRLRGSWLIADSPEDRAVIYGKLKDIYNYRSEVAHSGVLCNGNHTKINAVREAFPEYEIITEKICSKIIQNGIPDWDKLVLNVP